MEMQYTIEFRLEIGDSKRERKKYDALARKVAKHAVATFAMDGGVSPTTHLYSGTFFEHVDLVK